MHAMEPFWQRQCTKQGWGYVVLLERLVCMSYATCGHSNNRLVPAERRLQLMALR